MEQTMNNDREDELQEEVWWGEWESEAAPCACAPPRLVTPSKSQPWGVLLNFSTTSLHHHFPAWRCPCLSSTSTSQEVEKSAGGARGRRRSRRSPKLSGAHCMFKAQYQYDITQTQQCPSLRSRGGSCLSVSFPPPHSRLWLWKWLTLDGRSYFCRNLQHRTSS